MSTDDAALAILGEEEEDGVIVIPGLDGYKDARAAIRLIQCSRCSLPLRVPLTLPCGNSLCKACLPPSHTRENITYPPRTGRAEGIKCPFEECGQVHVLEECSLNVVLYDIVNAVADVAAKQLSVGPQEYETLLEEIVVHNSGEENIIKSEKDPPPLSEEKSSEKNWRAEEEVVDAAQLNEKHAIEEEEKKQPITEPRDDNETAEKDQQQQPAPVQIPFSKSLSGGRLIATYKLAQLGELPYAAEVKYGDPADGDSAMADTALLEEVKEFAHKELECHVCYFLMNDPITTPCGHTFCRACLARVLDHSNLCAVCRRALPSPTTLSQHPADYHLSSVLSSFWPDEVQARTAAIQADQRNLPGGLDTPLFICTMAFPHMPLLLHIFEPRYRLMIRRALDTNRRFGMLMYNARGAPQGDLGRTDFLQFGVLLHIDSYDLFADGRYFIACRGLSRFRVTAHDVLDGYVVGKIQKFDDVPLAEEERREAEETSAAAAATAAAAAAAAAATATPASGTDQSLPSLNTLSTQQLLDIGTAFVQRAREQSASWLCSRIMEVYGGPPDDPAIFPYWFASVLPIREEEKYKLLPLTSVRERLKLTAAWVRGIESQRWYHGSSCTVL